MAAELTAGGGDYLLPSLGFSAADILLVATLDWAEHPDYQWGTWAAEGEGDTVEKANLRAYLARCRDRPAYRKSKKDGGWLSSL